MKTKLILMFFFFYGVSLLVTLPAERAIAFIPKQAGIKVAQASGTLWNGKALQLSYKKDLQLQEVDWKFDWSALSHLQLKIAVKFNNGMHAMSGKGFIFWGFSGFSVEDLVVDSSAAELLTSRQLTVPVEVSGDVSLVIKKASQGSPYCQEMDGYLIWNDAKVNSEMGNVDLDSAHIDLSCREGMIVADVKQKSEQLTTTANFLLEEKGLYQVQGIIKAGDKLEPALKDALSWMGGKNQAGETKFQFNGKL